jgi:MFS family permease
MASNPKPSTFHLHLKPKVMGTEIFSHLNWLAIIVAAVAYFALGALWYSKILFVNPWIRMTGVKMGDPDAKKGLAQMMLTSLVLMIICSLGLALFLTKANPPLTWMSGAKTGLVAGLCFSSTGISVSYLYERRPLGLHLINGGYNVVGSMIAGIILAVWR